MKAARRSFEALLARLIRGRVESLGNVRPHARTAGGAVKHREQGRAGDEAGHEEAWQEARRAACLEANVAGHVKLLPELQTWLLLLVLRLLVRSSLLLLCTIQRHLVRRLWRSLGTARKLQLARAADVALRQDERVGSGTRFFLAPSPEGIPLGVLRMAIVEPELKGGAGLDSRGDLAACEDCGSGHCDGGQARRHGERVGGLRTSWGGKPMDSAGPEWAST
mmetsp:Transcript_44908/g.128832  ORF Transcript_44908/g.128832 Transcript_44908/m.128832 type:complete len:222 (+) Transcript_44908:273-938(+)